MTKERDGNSKSIKISKQTVVSKKKKMALDSDGSE